MKLSSLDKKYINANLVQDVFSKLAAGLYDPTSSAPTYPAAPKEKISLAMSVDEILAAKAEHDGYKVAVEKYNLQMQAHKEERNNLIKEFRRDLEKENGLTNHHRAEKLWEMAWERGHSSGLREVLSEYEELAELLK